METYATLLSQKLVLPSLAAGYVAVDRALWLRMLARWVAGVAVDEAWYRQRYSDVDEAIRSGLLSSAMQHYRERGYFEHRFPYAIAVDAEWYGAEYHDAAGAIAQGLFASAQHHFEEVGFKEGRLPYLGFALEERA